MLNYYNYDHRPEGKYLDSNPYNIVALLDDFSSLEIVDNIVFFAPKHSAKGLFSLS